MAFGSAAAKKDNWAPLVLPSETDALTSKLENLLIGQPQAIEAIVPHVRRFEAGLSPDRRPAGVLILLGPTGTGKLIHRKL